MQNLTKKYYEENAISYIKDTLECDMSSQYKLLEKYLKAGSKILDIGFGAGRDMLYFKSKGYDVCGIDNVKEFCDHATALGLNVLQLSILDLNDYQTVDAIWACASLLHIHPNDLPLCFKNCYRALKAGGYMYASFKYGDFQGELNGRYFTFMTEDSLKPFYEEAGFKLIELSTSQDNNSRNLKWLNIILQKI